MVAQVSGVQFFCDQSFVCLMLCNLDLAHFYFAQECGWKIDNEKKGEMEACSQVAMKVLISCTVLWRNKTQALPS